MLTSSSQVLTCRGRTNAVLVMDAISGDDSDNVARSLASNLDASALAQIQYVSVDNPSERYWQSLRAICPNLQVMSLDPTHLAMTFEYASSRRRTAGSKALRAVLQKLNAVDVDANADLWGPIHTGRNSRALTTEEQRVRNQIEDRSMRKADAEKILNSLDVDKPFYLRLEWIRALAAIASVHRDELDKVAPGPNRKLFKLLFSAADHSRSEWYMNNCRMRHMISPKRLALLPSGTTSNESLHHEINAWFRETQKLHQATLQLKLATMQLAKNICHNNALYWPTTRQVAQAELLARATSAALWEPREWQAWCAELADLKKPSKAKLRLHEKREQERLLVKKQVKKKPSCSGTEVGVKRRRTPLTLERQDSLRRAGVRPIRPKTMK